VIYAENYRGELVSIEDRGNITSDPQLSLWRANGFTLPKDIIIFREQVIGKERMQQVQMIILWKPEPAKAKAEGEL
jgi:hypothetical protein